MPRCNSKSARNEEIAWARDSGRTYSEMAGEYGISQERVRRVALNTAGNLGVDAHMKGNGLESNPFRDESLRNQWKVRWETAKFLMDARDQVEKDKERRAECRAINARVKRMRVAEITEAAVSDADARVRRAAVGRLRRQELLVKIADTDENYCVRVAAVMRIESIAELMRIAKSSRCREVRIAATERIEDDAMKAEILATEKDLEAACSITWMIRSQEILKMVARSQALHSDIRLTAIRKIIDVRELDGIGWDEGEEIRLLIVRKMDDQKFLECHALQDSSASVRAAAAARLNDQVVLKKIVRNSHEIMGVRFAAFHRIRVFDENYSPL